jgi:hypothetical protein
VEQQLDTGFLRPGPAERAGALAIGAVGLGLGVLLATWGISLLWRYTPPEIRIANPEVTVRQDGPLTVHQDRPFTIQVPGPLKVELPSFPSLPVTPNGEGGGGQVKTPAGDAIKREVTVFSTVDHVGGAVVSGWRYADGRGGVPVSEFCYYSAPSFDGSYKRVDIAHDRIAATIGVGLVPELSQAISKCQWSGAGRRMTLAE